MAKAFALSSLLILMSCTPRAPSLRARSAGDLHCPADVVKIYRLDDRSYRVVGCGQEVVYVSTCDGRRACTWVVNTSNSEATVHAQPTVPGGVSGCSYDAQCKGDRICVDRQCVTPPASPTNH